MVTDGYEHDRLNSRKVYERKRRKIHRVDEVDDLQDLVEAQEGVVEAQEIHAKNSRKCRLKIPVKKYSNDYLGARNLYFLIL